MTNNRKEFISTIQQALGVDGLDEHSRESRRKQLFPTTLDQETRNVLHRIHSRTVTDKETLLARLQEEARPLNLVVAPVADLSQAALYIAGLVRDRTPEWGEEKTLIRWSHPLIDALELETVLSEQNVPVYTTAMTPERDITEQRRAIRANTIQSFMGVTSADFCMANTATVVMKSYPDQGRAVSLVPSIHVAVLTLDQILADLTELYAILESHRLERNMDLTHNMTFISGPSKTADIELTMVHGAHGPREMHLVMIRS
ncbi:MAG: lactate utilization protein C [Desulfobacterales bacterium]|nr:MAG: lactate utilization protein C [Desulfobacterales bacterium]